MSEVTIFHPVTVIEFADEATAEEVIETTLLRLFTMHRAGPTTILVASDEAPRVIRNLHDHGFLPRMDPTP